MRVRSDRVWDGERACAVVERHTVFTIVTDLAEMASEHPHVDAMQVFLPTILLITLADLR